ncbi:hypothetical protein [Cohnella mopanensis]|uniref:hypothetical protein n=1 Tax=Cohnella mopanensis TaxID=2911966 RepID=UPI001EF8A96E|nr:hypothetical protein [Cohnella mopanensis]
MTDYRMDIERGLKQSLVNNARLQKIVRRIDFDRHNKLATRLPVKKIHLVAAAIIIVGFIPFGISFNPPVTNTLSRSISETITPTEVLPLVFSIDVNGNYTGFSNLPKNYTVEEAKKDGYIVEQDSVVIANNEVWASFVETAAQGNNTAVRMVSFLTEDNSSPFFRDLFFSDGYYSLFDSSSDKQDMQRYSHLVTLEGQFGNPLKNTQIVVLTDDNALSFNVVLKTLITSNMDYKQSVSPYRLVWFNESEK